MLRIIYYEILRILRTRKIVLYITGLFICIMFSLPNSESSYSIMNFHGTTGVRNSNWISTLSVLLASFYILIFGFYFLRNFFKKDIKSDKYHIFKSSNNLFDIIFYKAISFFAFGLIIVLVLITAIIFMQGIKGTLETFSLTYQLVLVLRYLFPVILFTCIVIFLFDIIPILATKLGGFIYVFIFVSLILNETRGNFIQFSPLYSIALQIGKIKGVSSTGYSIVTNINAVNYVELMPLDVNLIEVVLYNFVLMLVLLMMLFTISKLWNFKYNDKKTTYESTSDEKEYLSSRINENQNFEPLYNTMILADPVAIKESATLLKQTIRVEFHLLVSKCHNSLIMMLVLYLLWMINGSFFAQIMPIIFPVFMLPSLMFLIEYPKMYGIHDFMSTISLKQLNKNVRILFIIILIFLYIPIVMRSNFSLLNFSQSFLVAATGSLLLLSIAIFFMNSKHNYFEGVFLCLWYLGILNKVPYIDIFFGVNAPYIFVQIILNLVILTIMSSINYRNNKSNLRSYSKTN